MGSQYSRPGLGNVGSYQASGHPWITGSTVSSGQEYKFQFPFVSKRLKVQTVDASGGGHIRVHFVSSSAGNVSGGLHYWHVSDGEPLDMTVKCKEVYVSHDHGGATEFRIWAEMTNIPVGEMFELTGSGISD